MATPPRAQKESVNHLRLKFEDKDGEIDTDRSAATPGLCSPLPPRRDGSSRTGYGVPRKMPQIQRSASQTKFYRRSPESVLPKRSNMASSQGTSPRVVRNGTSIARPALPRQLSPENRAKVRGAQSQRVGKLSKSLEPKPPLPIKPTLPAKPKFLSTMARRKSRSLERLIETQSDPKEQSIYAKDKIDPETSSQSPEEGKPAYSVAERARLFSAEEPRAGASRQRKLSPARIGALTAKAWEESGDQGDDEDDHSEKLTSPSVGPDANRKRKILGNQQDSESSAKLLKTNKKTGRNQQGQDTGLPPAPSGLQKILPRWFWKSRFKSSSQPEAKTAGQCPGSSSVRNAEVPESEDPTADLHSDLSWPDASVKPPKVPGCKVASGLSSDHPELANSLSASPKNLDKAKGFGACVASSSSGRSLEAENQEDASSPLLSPGRSWPSQQPENAQIARDTLGGKQEFVTVVKEPKILADFSSKDAASVDALPEVKSAIQKPHQEPLKQAAKWPKILPDLSSKDAASLDAFPELKSVIQEPHHEPLKQEHLPQEHQGSVKPLLAVPKKEFGVSGMVQVHSQPPQIPHRNRNGPVAPLLKVPKPPPKPPIRETSSTTVRVRQVEPVEPSAEKIQLAEGLAPQVSAENSEVVVAKQPRENRVSEADQQITTRSNLNNSATADRNLAQSSPSKSLKDSTKFRDNNVTPKTNLPSEDDQNTEGHCCLLTCDSKSNNSKPLPNGSRSSVSPETVVPKTAVKPAVVPRLPRRAPVTLVDGCFLKTLPKVPEEDTQGEEGTPAASDSPKPRPRVPRRSTLPRQRTAPLKETPGSEDPDSNVSKDKLDIVRGYQTLLCETPSSEYPDKMGEQASKEQDSISSPILTVTEGTNPKDVEQPKLQETWVADTESSSTTSTFAKTVLSVFIENPDSDNESGSCDKWEGGDCDVHEPRVIPLRPNKLLQGEHPPQTGRSDLRRTSSLEDIPIVPVSFTNARGLFQQAQFMKSCETLPTTAKPPIPSKPNVFKKPALSNTQGGISGRPAVPTKTAAGSPLRPPTKPKVALKPTGQSGMDNYYEEVYHEGTDDPQAAGVDRTKRPSSRKLEKILGPDFSEQDWSGNDKSKITGKGALKPQEGPRRRKVSAPVLATTEGREGPYAVTPLLDADKTAAKKSKSPAEQKTRQISDGNGNKVVLRNSGGMSSGDSGIVGLHREALHVGAKRTMSRSDRRMSRRVLRKQIKSMDSDFTEDSDDEPIGADSEFDDSDSSLEEPIVFVDDAHQKAFEVLTTERTYVDTLHLISEIFQKQIEEENKEKGWFQQSFINEIFSNIASIYQLHSTVLLPDLDHTLKNWEKNPCLGEVLKKNAPFLKLYSDYVSNFDHAMKQLKDLTAKAPKFAARLVELQQHELCGNLALQHHMLTPIQRIPRYELLLKEYLKKLPDGCKDRADAEKALFIISGAAQHSNDMMKSMDQFEKLLKINEKIDGENIIDPTRHLLKEGKLTMIAAKNKEPQDRYVILFNDILLCCEKRRLLTSSSYKVKMKMEVDDEMKVSVLDSDCCGFIIANETKSIEFKVNSEEDREEWMRVLLSAIQEIVRKKDTFRTNNAAGEKRNSSDAKDKSMPGIVAPKWIRDDETSMCMRCGAEFKLTKRRHHCRGCGAVVCHKCCSYESALEYDDNKVNKVCYKCFHTKNGNYDELEKINSTRKSLLNIDEDSSFGSHLYLLQKGVWTKFWVVATDTDVFILKAPKDVRPVQALTIKPGSFTNLPDSDSERENVFRLTSSDKRVICTLSAESQELKRRWVAVLNQGHHPDASKTFTL